MSSLEIKYTNMNKTKYKKMFATIISFVVLASATAVLAVEPYTRLVPDAFAGFETNTPGNSLGKFLGGVFNFGIAAAVTLALIMIIWGGIIYMTTDSWTGKEDGKSKIKDALWGLGLALVSYLILYTINPCLVDFLGNKGCVTPNTFLK